jgi:hypothetical protein
VSTASSKKGLKKKEKAPVVKKSSSSSSVWDWRKDLMEVLRNLAGLAKLNRCKPSTASIGNWGVMDSVSRLSEKSGSGSLVTARLFMGRKKTTKSKIDVGLSAKDDEQTVSAQWHALR